MFDRFTDRARRVLVLAQEEARLLRHNFIGTEHLLLGLLREGDGVAAKALGELGVRLDDVRELVKETTGPPGSAPTGSPPFTPRTKKVLELSLREALQLGHNYIGTEHILLGLVREGEGVAAQVLVSLGAELPGVRQQVIQILSGQAPARLGEGAESRAEAEAPRCGRCDASLSRSARYRMIEVAPDNVEPRPGPLEAVLLYCGDCGTVLGPYVAVGAEFMHEAGMTVSGQVTQKLVPVRSRRFPDELLAPVELADVAEEARVELVYRDNEVIEGTAGSKAVRLAGRVGSHRGPLRGSWGGLLVNADWRIGDNSPTLAPVSGLIGNFGEDAVKLSGDFRLAPTYFFDQAEIVGDFGATAFRAVVSAVDGGLGSTDALVAEGTLGETPFELYAALSGDRTRAVLRGSVDGRSLSLDATRDSRSGPVRLQGSYSGPPALLALAVGALAYFL